MKFGLYISPSENSTYHDSVEQAVLADQLGYSSIWLTEKHFEQGHLLWSSPLITASYIAAKTQIIQIGFAPCISTLHHPVRLAEDFANLDVLSRGRLIVGLTRTSLSNQYHEVFQSPIKKAWKKFDEQFEIIQKLWQGEFNKYSGSFYNIPAITLYPALVQKPMPPIFFIASSDDSIVDAARRGVGIFLHSYQSIKDIRLKKKLYEDSFIDKLGLKPQIILSRFIYTGANNHEAITDIKNPFMQFIKNQYPTVPALLEKQYQKVADFNFFKEELCIFGDINECIEKINTLANETGINSFTLTFNFTTLAHQKCTDSLKRFALGAFPKLINKCKPEIDAAAFI